MTEQLLVWMALSILLAIFIRVSLAQTEQSYIIYNRVDKNLVPSIFIKF